MSWFWFVLFCFSGLRGLLLLSATTSIIEKIEKINWKLPVSVSGLGCFSVCCLGCCDGIFV